jgi:hypothetical protein
MTLAIVVGAPISVILMITMLFRSGAFDRAAPNPGVALMILFWVAFGSSFFGIAYGLLQICTEFPILYRSGS